MKPRNTHNRQSAITVVVVMLCRSTLYCIYCDGISSLHLPHLLYLAKLQYFMLLETQPLGCVKISYLLSQQTSKYQWIIFATK